MDFHTVYTGVLAELGGFCKGFDDFVNLLFGHLGTFDIVCPAGFLRRGRCKLMGGVDDGLYKRTGELVLVQRCDKLGDCPGTSHSCGELDEQLCACLVDFVHEYLEVAEHFLVLPEPFAPESITQGSDAGDDQTYIVVRSFEKQLCSLLVEVAAGQFKPAEQRCTAHGTHDNAVFDFHIADFPRCKQRFVLFVRSVHESSSFPMMLYFELLIISVYRVPKLIVSDTQSIFR